MAAKELLRIKMRFIGVVKTATRKFPMAYLSGIELQARGDRKGLLAKDEDGKPFLLSFVWLDRERRYFIASGQSLSEGLPYFRERWRQLDQEPDSPPTRVQLTIAQPKAAETYYSACGKIDQHNRDRQDTLMIERKLKTHDWSTRVNFSLLSICFVDAWRVYSRMTFGETNEDCNRETQKEFYGHLSAELIDNTYDFVGGIV
jgi:Transposase IS4